MKKLLPGIVVFIIIVTYFKYTQHKYMENLKKLKEEYPAISISEGVDATITNIYHSTASLNRNNPHHAYVLLNDTLKKRLRTGFELNQRKVLDEILSEGMRLEKKSGTDTIYLYKFQFEDTVKYTFTLKDDLGYDLEKTE